METGSGGCGQFITLCLCCSFLLTLFPCSSVGGPSHGTQRSTNFSNVSPSHRLQFFTNCSSMGPSHRVNPSGADCSSAGPPWGHKSCQKAYSSMGCSLLGFTGPSRSLLQHGFPMGLQPPSGIHLLRRGVIHWLQVGICSTLDLHGLQVDSLPHHGLHYMLQGNLCSGTWSTSSPSYFADLGVCRDFPHIFSFLSPSDIAIMPFFLPFLNMLAQRH